MLITNCQIWIVLIIVGRVNKSDYWYIIFYKSSKGGDIVRKAGGGYYYTHSIINKSNQP